VPRTQVNAFRLDRVEQLTIYDPRVYIVLSYLEVLLIFDIFWFDLK